MDLMKYSEEVYKEIQVDYKEFVKQLDIFDIYFVLILVFEGDNVVNLSEYMFWYDGKILMEMLESIEINKDVNIDDFCFLVQYVNCFNLDFCGFVGIVVFG